MKVYVHPPGEQWICDRFTDEWYAHNADISTKDPREADVIWLIADWCYNQLPYNLLQSKKVVTTNFHIVPEKFDARARADFMRRDAITDLYHASCDKTAEYLREIGATKPIRKELTWVNGELWRDLAVPEDNKDPELSLHYQRRLRVKKELGFDDDEFVIGSFQRDTEGHDLASPKLEKGPDILADFVQLAIPKLKEVGLKPVVLLGGWRRQYIKRRLNEMGVAYVYKELPDFETLNTMYNAVDLYVVGSRHEGGPQSILECAITRTPIISTDVGVARDILHPNAIAKEVSAEALLECTDNMQHAYDRVQELLIPNGFKPFRKMFEELV